jgi:hypothetical protein
MTLFEFVTVMISMILALSLGHLLEGISYLIRVRDRVRWDPSHSLWLAFLILTLVNHWWSLWDMHDLAWNYASFLYILIAPVVLSFAASFLAPDRPESGPIDLSTHFSRMRQPFAVALSIYVLAMWFDGPIFAGQRLLSLISLLHIPILGAVVLAFFSKERLVNIVAPCITIVTLSFIIFLRLSAVFA